MTTQQEISGVSDQEFVERMVERYPRRFNDQYWSVFKANVGRHLPAEPVIVDLGCGRACTCAISPNDTRVAGFTGATSPRP